MDHPETSMAAGDNHHSCLYTHAWHGGGRPVRERTVPTISWMQGEVWPGYSLLTIRGSEAEVVLCSAPSQLMILIVYGVYIVGILVWLAISARRIHKRRLLDSMGTRSRCQHYAWVPQVVLQWLVYVACIVFEFGAVRSLSIRLA